MSLSSCTCGCSTFYHLCILNCGHVCCWNCLVRYPDPDGRIREELINCPLCDVKITNKTKMLPPVTQLDRETWDNPILLELAVELKKIGEYDEVSRMLYRDDTETSLNKFIIKAKSLAIQQLKDEKDTINTTRYRNRTLLYDAIVYADDYWCEFPYIELELLLKYGADPNLCSHKNRPPLYSAKKLDNERALCLLLDYGANPDVKYKSKSLTGHAKYISPYYDMYVFIYKLRRERNIRVILYWLKHAYYRPPDGPGYLKAIM